MTQKPPSAASEYRLAIAMKVYHDGLNGPQSQVVYAGLFRSYGQLLIRTILPLIPAHGGRLTKAEKVRG